MHTHILPVKTAQRLFSGSRKKIASITFSISSLGLFTQLRIILKQFDLIVEIYNMLFNCNELKLQDRTRRTEK